MRKPSRCSFLLCERGREQNSLSIPIPSSQHPPGRARRTSEKSNNFSIVRQINSARRPAKNNNYPGIFFNTSPGSPTASRQQSAKTPGLHNTRSSHEHFHGPSFSPQPLSNMTNFLPFVTTWFAPEQRGDCANPVQPHGWTTFPRMDRYDGGKLIRKGGGPSCQEMLKPTESAPHSGRNLLPAAVFMTTLITAALRRRA